MSRHTDRWTLDGDRYFFDFNVCTQANGWAQIDTSQDASYYGNWINPFKREMLSFCEGDVTVTTANDDQDFAAMVEETILWHAKNTKSEAKIDPGNNGKVLQAFENLGLAKFFHKSFSAPG